MYDPDSYDVYSDLQRRDARELYPYIISKMDWRRGRHVLDFGCGSGYITKNIMLPLVEKKTKGSILVKAVDLSEKMIEFANHKYEDAKITWAAVDLMKDDQNEIGNWKFHKIFSSHVLHWILDQEKALRTLFNLLHRRGELGIYFFPQSPIFSAYKTLGENPKWSPYMFDVDKFVPKTQGADDPVQDIREMMTRIGFEVQEVTILHRIFYFDNFQILVNSALAVNPFIKRIPIQLHQEYKSDLELTLLPHVCHPGSQSENPHALQHDYQVMLVRASKY